jgi:hypothetical protein
MRTWIAVRNIFTRGFTGVPLGIAKQDVVRCEDDSLLGYGTV